MAVINILTPEVYTKIIDKIDMSNSDLKRYKKTFKLLDEKDFESADKHIPKIDNQILMGHVLAKKYLQTKYKSTTDELREWLDLYAELPQAAQIRRLAIQKGATDLKDSETTINLDEPELKKIPLQFLERLSVGNRKFLAKQGAKFRMNLRKGKTLAARKILENTDFKSLAPKPYWDSLAAALALKYLVDNYDNKALEWGNKASKRHNSGVATWVAGLASWRLKKFKSAASYFERLGSSQNSDEWLVSAGGYWAARAYQKLGNHLKAEEMLNLAAKEKYTFYGILAAHKLGKTFDFEFQKDAYMTDFETYDYVEEILSSSALTRALLLFKIKQTDLAEKELLHVYEDLSDTQKEAVILIAHQKGLHSFVIAVSRNKSIQTLKGHYEKEMYPLPNWSKDKEWKVDKALVLALIRQESAFKDNATSHAGARGLMQLMPNTAYYISGDKTFKTEKEKLLNLDNNLELGQRYVSYLLEKPFIEGNLFYMLTAYNGGPGNLVKWQKSARYGDDPLLFIEVIPSAETRIYIERVMANYWIYNMRFNKNNKTLNQLTADKWPIVKTKSYSF